MYGIFTYIWVIYGVNVGKYSSTMDHLGRNMIGPQERLHDEYGVSQCMFHE